MSRWWTVTLNVDCCHIFLSHSAFLLSFSLTADFWLPLFKPFWLQPIKRVSLKYSFSLSFSLSLSSCSFFSLRLQLANRTPSSSQSFLMFCIGLRLSPRAAAAQRHVGGVPWEECSWLAGWVWYSYMLLQSQQSGTLFEPDQYLHLCPYAVLTCQSWVSGGSFHLNLIWL